ncbi:hypothetical protein CLAFUW4_04775 [Fulvia fulva]|uniref:Uncharacterized protein n=1 Tax=Passalora fulva TaxID=5499 RepID=A0A9Q8PIQ6_PASFU|nr:uncharacterized protein CLAFUR5_12125 [Fulvia fulva]KAK4626166.1 hypothetical protein CLAFUR4_04761 [Fulvia fulva]KAK4627510.1 hypothetical protein CLAFUR0_04765 [Fulvia fulva]UJO23161.1 hypothetical protein CLAFUR5_12125 [Fulvia fulva]WPV13811.1 hypothetical protein CLAFUW4_04775 [Fulvia fulva]WPV28885.1 hypothetical protein CLAFUW7_04769 [Fulvia fulva]
MTRQLSVVEPHPTVPKKGGYVMAGGRGGSGNYRKYKSEEVTDGASATGPASRVSLTRPFTKRIVTSGRGGAGNMFSPSTSDTESTIFQFDEEMANHRENVTPVYRVGRGGAGNTFTDDSKSQSLSMTRKPSTDSAASSTSDRISITRQGGNVLSSIFSRRSS